MAQIQTMDKPIPTSSMSEADVHSEFDKVNPNVRTSPQAPKEPFKGWPNDQGFDESEDVLTPTDLRILGEIPSYAAGTLYRTGPGRRHVATDKGNVVSMQHWFDGLSQVHRFQIHPSASGRSISRVTYNSRSTVDERIEHIKRTGRLDGFTFARKYDPCESFFKKVMSKFYPGPFASNPDPNVGVTLSVNAPFDSYISDKPSRKDGHASGVKSLWANTDAAPMKRLDPETLEPIGVARQTALHPELTGPLSASHARSDPVTGDVYNFNLAFGREAVYRVFHVSAETGETRILARITDADPAYVHSFCLTENYVILCVWNSYVSGRGASLLWYQNVLDCLCSFDDSRPTKWYVVDRHDDKGVVATFESDPFYCFHTVNSWEETSPTDKNQTDVVVDLIAYTSLDILKKFYYENLASTSPSAHEFNNGPTGKTARGAIHRYRLPGVTGETASGTAPRRATAEWKMSPDEAPELPTLNPSFVTRPSRFVYTILDRYKSTFSDGLAKFDTKTGEKLVWDQHAHSPSEAIFVPNPEGKDEDDGILLSVVLDGLGGRSYLLCLDAKNMQELGRAELDKVVAFGFHGSHISVTT